MEKLRKRLRKESNKGFSLVELIIVIAIMAILVGIVALQVIPYLERSRESKDITQLDALHSALVTALADEDIARANAGDFDEQYTGTNVTSSGNLQERISELLGISGDDLAGNMTSANAVDQEVWIGRTGGVTFAYVQGSTNAQSVSGDAAIGEYDTVLEVASRSNVTASAAPTTTP